MFLLPFNLIILVAGSSVANKVFRGSAAIPASGVKVWNDGFQVRVRLSQMRPFTVAAVVSMIMAFVAIFVALGFGGAHPPLEVMVVAWYVVLAGWLLSYLACRWKQAQGGSDLLIDTTAGQVTLPRNMGRKAEVTIPTRSITSIEVQKILSRGPRGEMFYYYLPTLNFTDTGGSICQEKLFLTVSQTEAEALAAWLREQFQMDPHKEDLSRV